MRGSIVVALLVSAVLSGRTPGTAAQSTVPVAVDEITIERIEAGLRARQLTCRQLVDT